MSTHQQDGGGLQRVDSYQWPSGHVSHLTENQLAALATFKSLCTQHGYFTPADPATSTPASHDDETLLRYLRARKFLPQEAFAQFKDTEDWRAENQLDMLYETIDVQEYEQTRRLYPQWTGRRDKRGIPFYVYEVAHIDAKDVSAYNSGKDAKHAASQSTTSRTPRKMLRLFALYENLCRFVLPLCSAIPDRPHSETPISQSNNIVDISKVGFTKFWSLRNHMSDASKLATAHYPETLDRIFVVGAPGFFPTVWEWAKKWFDPITVSKIFILGDKNMLETLSKYVDVDNIPKKYGGNLDWSFGDMPFLEAGIADNLQWNQDVKQKGHRTLPIGPIRWGYDDKGDLVATAIGSENGKRRHTVIAGLHPEAGVARLALSPGRNTADTPTTNNHLGAAAVGPQASGTTTKQQEMPQATGKSAPAQQNTIPTKDDHPDLRIGKDPDSAVQDTSRTGTYTVPYRPRDPDGAVAVASPHPDARQGTSSTRFEQQGGTHSEGQLANGTPEVKIDGQGEKQGVMEPRTVGQAPKEHPVPTPVDESAPAPSMMEQAQNYAGQAVEQAKALPGTVMAAVGMGGGAAKSEEPVAEVTREDPAVDGMEKRNVEEFLREQSMSAQRR